MDHSKPRNPERQEPDTSRRGSEGPPVISSWPGEDLHFSHRVSLEISWKSVFRLLLGVLLGYTAILLWPIFKMLVLATLIAVALYPIVRWISRKGGPEWLGILAASAILLLAITACFAVIAPLVFHQMSNLGDSLPRLREQILAQMPASGPLRRAFESTMDPGTVADSTLMLQRLRVVVESTIGGIVYGVVVIALTIYLLLDGLRAVKWLIVFFPVAEREKISEALRQISRLVSSYVGGQFVVSACCAAYLFLVLKLLGVPMALLLGIVAGVCDILPIIGFAIAVFLAMAMGLSISPGTAALIFVLYGAYHLFENFFIVPKVYGRKLRLSKLAVPLAVAAGGLLAGVVGAIAVLPVVAAYPVLERLWLAPRLAPDTVKAHGTDTA